MSLCDWQLLVRSLYDPIDADNGIAKMEEKIRRQLAMGPKTERQLKQNTNAHRSGIWFFETARKNLERAKEIVWDIRVMDLVKGGCSQKRSHFKIRANYP